MEEGMAIENKRISKGIERAQKKVEERNFGIRKNLLEYDEVMDYQRQIFYRQRQQILEGKNLDQMIWQMIEEVVDEAVENFLDERLPRKSRRRMGQKRPRRKSHARTPRHGLLRSPRRPDQRRGQGRSSKHNLNDHRRILRPGRRPKRLGLSRPGQMGDEQIQRLTLHHEHQQTRAGGNRRSTNHRRERKNRPIRSYPAEPLSRRKFLEISPGRVGKK